MNYLVCGNYPHISIHSEKKKEHLLGEGGETHPAPPLLNTTIILIYVGYQYTCLQLSYTKSQEFGYSKSTSSNLQVSTNLVGKFFKFQRWHPMNDTPNLVGKILIISTNSDTKSSFERTTNACNQCCKGDVLPRRFIYNTGSNCFMFELMHNINTAFLLER